jgi:hypothetical protein
MWKPAMVENMQTEIRGQAMQEDERCCGTGTCIIDANGLCWCGQQWDGEKMCRPAPVTSNSEIPLKDLTQKNEQADPS